MLDLEEPERPRIEWVWGYDFVTTGNFFNQPLGMRNIVIHQYWDVDLDVVWEVATRDIPALVRQLKPPPTLVRSRPLRRRI